MTEQISIVAKLQQIDSQNTNIWFKTFLFFYKFRICLTKWAIFLKNQEKSKNGPNSLPYHGLPREIFNLQLVNFAWYAGCFCTSEMIMLVTRQCKLSLGAHNETLLLFKWGYPYLWSINFYLHCVILVLILLFISFVYMFNPTPN